MTDKSKSQSPAVSDPVDNQAEKDDAERKRPQPHTQNLTLLGLAQVELNTQIPDDVCPDDESERRRNQGDKTRPEEPLGGFFRFS